MNFPKLNLKKASRIKWSCYLTFLNRNLKMYITVIRIKPYVDFNYEELFSVYETVLLFL